MIAELYRRQQFFPGLLGLFVNPYFLARRALVRAIGDLAPRLQGCLLDVGCGTKPYRDLFKVSQYVGIDIDSLRTRKWKVADVLYDGRSLPIEGGSVDSILCSQVLEHVFEPQSFLSELHRVLKPGGRLLLTVPFVWDEHEQPYDYGRYTSFGLSDLLQRHGFEVTDCRKLCADSRALFQLLNAYLVKVSWKWPRPARALLVVTLMALVNALGHAAGALLPRNGDLFLDLVILAEKRR